MRRKFNAIFQLVPVGKTKEQIFNDSNYDIGHCIRKIYNKYNIWKKDKTQANLDAYNAVKDDILLSNGTSCNVDPFTNYREGMGNDDLMAALDTTIAGVEIS